MRDCRVCRQRVESDVTFVSPPILGVISEHTARRALKKHRTHQIPKLISTCVWTLQYTTGTFANYFDSCKAREILPSLIHLYYSVRAVSQCHDHRIVKWLLTSLNCARDGHIIEILESHCHFDLQHECHDIKLEETKRSNEFLSGPNKINTLKHRKRALTIISNVTILWAELNLQKSIPCWCSSIRAPHCLAFNVSIDHRAIIWLPSVTESSVTSVYWNLILPMGWWYRSTRDSRNTWWHINNIGWVLSISDIHIQNKKRIHLQHYSPHPQS